MSIYIKVIYISLFIFSFLEVNSQERIENPSFEDKPADATMPRGWFACSKGTTPDILPGYWGVYDEAEEGDTYVGLIIRPDGSFESIGQRLKAKVEKSVCYNMGLYLSHSENYAGYGNPLKLRVWLGKKKNKREQLIFESPLIEDEGWIYFPFDFIPTKDMKYIILEAYHENNSTEYKGNILIDGVENPKICSKV